VTGNSAARSLFREVAVLPALLIVFREVFEAGLIIGIVMAVTSGVAGRVRWIAGGVVAGVVGACIVALFAGGLSQLFGGSGQELFNACILGFAVLMLGWHNVWMARHGRELAAEMRAAGEAVVEGSKSLAALALVVTIAVLREGSEVVLFLYGVAAADGGAGINMLIGGVLGLLLGSLVCLLTYLGLVTIPARYLFGVTSTLIALLAAGMAAQAIAFLQQADILTAFDRPVWDTSWILRDGSFAGRALHTLIGYVDQPTAMQLIVYTATLIAIAVLMKMFAGEPSHHHRTV
jgi:high-affinity iron transporter